MRDTLILVGLALLAAIVAAVIFYAGGAAAPQHSAPVTLTGTPVSVTTLAAGTHSTVSERTNYLITSQDQLQQLWKMTDAGGSPPSVDFTQDAVIGVFAGQEPTGGYSIAIAAVADSGTVRAVLVSLAKPGGSCILPQVVTAPYEIVEMPRTGLQLTHQDETTTTSCLQ